MSPIKKKLKLVVVVGPTASGKTSLGITLARRFGGEIISADSRQIYRGMDIGTAKAPISYSSSANAWDEAGRKNATIKIIANEPVYAEGIPHHLVDIRNPDEDYSVGEFKREADAVIEDIAARGKVPILVGGTGLYIKSVVENLDIPEIKADPKLRARIEKEIAARGLDEVFKKLIELDPEAAYVVDPKNPRRVVRALEVAMITGKPFTAQRRKNEPLYKVLEIGINPPQDVLRERIDRRIDGMVRDGLVDEVKILLKKYGGAGGSKNGAGKKRPVAFDAIGYREIIDALAGRCSVDAAITAMKMNTWHFAKRQMTWFKKDKKIKWVTEETKAMGLVQKFLS